MTIRPWTCLLLSSFVLGACRHDTASASPDEPARDEGDAGLSVGSVEPPTSAAADSAALPTEKPPVSATAPAQQPTATPASTAAATPTVSTVAAKPEPAPEPRSLLDLPEASVTIGEVTADGLRVGEMACVVSRPLLGSLAIVASLSKQDRALDRCAARGDVVIARWTVENGRPRDVTVSGGSSAKVNACVAAAMRKVSGSLDAQCQAVLLIGAPEGADAARARLIAAAP